MLACRRILLANNNVVAIITTFMQNAFINATIITEYMIDSGPVLLLLCRAKALNQPMMSFDVIVIYKFVVFGSFRSKHSERDKLVETFTAK